MDWRGVCIEIFLSDFLTNTFVAVCTIRVPKYLHYSDPCLKMQAFRSFRGDDNCRVDCRWVSSAVQEGDSRSLTAVQLVNVCLINATSYVYFELLSDHDLAGVRPLQPQFAHSRVFARPMGSTNYNVSIWPEDRISWATFLIPWEAVLTKFSSCTSS